VKNKSAPKHLRPATKQWWQSVVRDFQLEEHHVLLLTACAEAWDRIQEARELVATEGMFPTIGRTRKLHPALALERDSKILFARLLRELSLDIDGPAEEYSRPPRISGRYDQ
jgi:phage terminase small subunit